MGLHTVEFGDRPYSRTFYVKFATTVRMCALYTLANRNTRLFTFPTHHTAALHIVQLLLPISVPETRPTPTRQ